MTVTYCVAETKL